MERMTNAEKYQYWLKAQGELEIAFTSGRISSGEYERMCSNMEERLGMNNWTKEQWLKEMGQ